MSSGSDMAFGEDIYNFMDRWVGSVAVVTGASAGIGAAICERLVRLGLTVVGMARRVDAMEELAAKLEASGAKGKMHPVFCDLRDEKNIADVFVWIEENHGGVSLLINNAGLMLPTTLVDGDVSAWKTQMDVNVVGLCICTKEAIASMKRHGIDGHIIHVNSIVGHFVPEMPVACLNVYPATKHAVTALTEGLRKELRGLEQPRIKISSVSPGLVATDFIEGFTTEGGLREGLKQAPALTAMDVADTIIFVLSTPPHVQVHDVIVKVFGEAF